MTPAEIEPATVRFVAQHLNHCATAVTLIHLVLRLKTSVEEPLFPSMTLWRAQVQLYFPL